MASGYAPFDDCTNEFRKLIRDMERSLHDDDDNDDKPPPDASHPRPNKDLSKSLRQCEDLLLQMKVEARDAPGSSLKRELMDIYSACQMQLTTYQSLHRQKDELFRDHYQASNQQKQKQSVLSSRLRATTQDRVQDQNTRLEGALKSLRETEELAGSIGVELHRNRNSIQRAKGNVGKLSGMMEQANGHLKGMMRKWF